MEVTITPTITEVTQAVNIKSCVELDHLIQEKFFKYNKMTRKDGTALFTGKNNFGREESIEAVPKYTRFPLNCRAIKKKLWQNNIEFSAFQVEDDQWRVVLGSKRDPTVATHEFLHIAFIKAVLILSDDTIVDVENLIEELKDKSTWYSSLCPEYQIHVVSDSLHDEIRKVERELERLQDEAEAAIKGSKKK